MYTAKKSTSKSQYYIIYLNGKAHRVCHVSDLQSRYPNIKIED